MADHLLLETGFRVLLEAGGDLLLETSTSSTTGDFLVQEEDGVSRYTLEDGSGSILLETATPVTPVVTAGGTISVRRRILIPRRVLEPENDELTAMTLLLATRHRHRTR